MEQPDNIRIRLPRYHESAEAQKTEDTTFDNLSDTFRFRTFHSFHHKFQQFKFNLFLAFFFVQFFICCISGD